MSITVAFEEGAGYLIARVEGPWTEQALRQAIIDVAKQAQDRDHTLVLVDALLLSKPPMEFDRYSAGEDIGKAWKGLKVALVYPAALINRFTEDTAVNRGTHMLVFSGIDEAREWLMSSPP